MSNRQDNTPHDYANQMLDSMHGSGIRPTESIANDLLSGKLIRFHAEGDKPGRKNGWAILHLDDRPAGAFGHYRLGVQAKWVADRRTAPTKFPGVDRRQIDMRKAEREQEIARCHDTAAANAVLEWDNAGTVNARHAYLTKKKLPGAGLRQAGRTLLAPMLNADGDMRNLQRIAPDGSKFFLKGGQTRGLMLPLGFALPFDNRGCQPAPGSIVVAEGYATSAAINLATGSPCAAAFSAANLPAVATDLRRVFGNISIIIFADADEVGRRYAMQAARLIDGLITSADAEGGHL